MAKKNPALLMSRVLAITAATLFFTTLALPFSPVRLPLPGKLVSTMQVKPLSMKRDSRQAITDQNSVLDVKQPSPTQFSELNARLFSEYGAVMKAQHGVIQPPLEMFSSQEEVAEWRGRVATSGKDYVLQTAASEALNAAREEAHTRGLDITPRDTDSAARDYAYTVKLWMSRVNPGLDHWVKKGTLEFGAGRACPQYAIARTDHRHPAA